IGDRDAEAVLERLDELDEIERVDVEVLPGLALAGLHRARHLDGVELFADGLQNLGVRGYGHRGTPVHAPSPPSTDSVAPLTYAASSETRKLTAAATSSGCPTRPAGITPARSPLRSAVISVAMKPGVIALHVTPLRAISRATVRVKPSSPALAAT